MDTESALWTLSTIGQATAALIGLVVIAVVFFMDRHSAILRDARFIFNCPIFTGKSARIAILVYPIAMLLIGLVIPLYFGINTVIHSVNELVRIQGNNPLDNATRSEVLKVVNEFKGTMTIVVVLVTSWMAFGYIFSVYIELLTRLKPDYEKVEAMARLITLGRIDSYVNDRFTAGILLTSENILKEFDLGIKSLYFASLGSDLRKLVGSRFPRIRIGDSDVRDYVSLVLEERIIEWPLPKDVPGA